MTLKERITDFIKFKGLSISRFEASIGLSNGAVSKMGDNTRRTTLDKISKHFPELNMVWLQTGEGNMLITNNPENFFISREVENDEIKTRPRVPLDAAAGSLSVISQSVSEAQCERLPIISRFPQYDFTIIVKGDSMEPEFRPGDEIACRFIDEPSFIQWGRPHVLDTNQGVVLKRIYNEPDTILCRSDNNSYEDFEIPKEDIFHIALVVGSVRLF